MGYLRTGKNDRQTDRLKRANLDGLKYVVLQWLEIWLEMAGKWLWFALKISLRRFICSRGKRAVFRWFFSMASGLKFSVY